MAKLPRSPIAQDVRNNYSPVREARASSEDPVGGALKQAGDAGFELGERMATAKINADMTKASIRLRSKLDAARREIEADMESDPATFEARFRERAAEIANEEAGTLTSPAGRKAFGLKAQEDVEDYSIRMRDVTRRRQVENVKADTLQAGAAYEQLAKDPAQPRELLDATRADYDALIDRQHKAGIYTADEAAAAKIASDEVYRAGVSTRHLTNVDAMLDAGRYGEAEEYFKANYGEIDPAQREKVEEVLETKTRDGEAVSLADEYWANSGGDYGAAQNYAYQIDDPDLRLKVEARLAQLKTQFDAAINQKKSNDLDAGMSYVVQGARPPSEWFRTADPEAVYTVQERLRARDEQALRMAGMTAEQRALANQISVGNYRSLKAALVNDPELAASGLTAVLADPYMQGLYDEMMPDEQGQFNLDMANAAKNGGAPVDEVSKAYKAVVSVAATYLPESLTAKTFSSDFKGLGEGDPGAKKYGSDKSKKDAAVMFERELMRLVEDEVRRTGNAEIPADRAKQLVALSYAAAGKKDDGSTKYPISGDVAGGIVVTQAQRQIVDFRQRYPDQWSAAASAVRAKYPEASDALILQEAQRIKAYQDAEAAKDWLGGLFGGD